MKRKSVSAVKTMALIILPVVFLCIFVLGNDWSRWGMWNDNQRQWIHPMDSALRQFFSGKGMPLYNFYNYKGVEIFDEGYNGLYNPLIWLAWLVARGLHAETMPVYQLICCILGNAVVCLILSELKVSYFKSWLCMLAYFFSPTFFSCGNWYYVWMNYWILPLLLYSILRWENTKTITNVIGTAFILLFSILSGNSQYTFMHFLTWGGVGLAVCLYRDRKNIKRLFGSALLSVILGMPYLYGLLIASQRSQYFNSGSSFLVSPMHPVMYIVKALIPNRPALMERLSKFLLPNQLGYIYYNSSHINYIFMGTLILGAALFFGKAIGKRKQKQNLSYQEVVGLAAFAMILFWLLYLGGASLLYWRRYCRMFR